MARIPFCCFNLALAFCIIFGRVGGYSVVQKKESSDLSARGNDSEEGTLKAVLSGGEGPRGISGNSKLRLPRGLPNEGTSEEEGVSEITIGKSTDIGVSTAGKGPAKTLPDSTEGEHSTNQKCHEVTPGGDGRSFRIISRNDWKALATNTIFETRSKPAKYVVISSATKRCYHPKECAAGVRQAQEESIEDERDELSSFYIGDDGCVYEGLGWYLDDTWQKEGYERWSLVVTFLGEYQDDIPSPIATEAYDALMKHSVSTGNLSPDYVLTSIRMLYDNSSYLGDMLENHIRNWDRYTDQIDLYSGTVLDMAGLFTIVFREEWNATKADITFEEIETPVEYVIVSNYLERCYITEECVDLMQSDQSSGIEYSSDLLFNFYIADDGFAYEGRGWDIAPYYTFEKIRNKYIIVTFFGNFQSYPPSQRAFLAFNKLLRLGVWLGKISPNYKILSVHDYYDGDFFLGDRLEEELKKMDRFTDSI